MAKNNKKENPNINTESIVIDNTETNTVTVLTGVVSNCELLNVRSRASDKGDNVLQTIDKGTKVEIDATYNNSKFYKITLPGGSTGYCMKDFISIE